MRIFQPPVREYVIIAAVALLLAADFLLFRITAILFFAALAGSLPTFFDAARALAGRKIRIEAFNAFALAASFGVREIRSAAFIVLMLSFASLLDWLTESRTRRAMEELLRLKPDTALRERNGTWEEVAAEEIRIGDTVLVKTGERIPVDGVVVFGSALVNESPVSGESVPAQKVVGDAVLSATLNESGVMRVRAERVGRDSTIERLAALVAEASRHKSRSEKLADRFAGIFLPAVLVFGAIVYAFTRDIRMTAAIFLVACADDMALAIPLAMTAAIGTAARRGIIVKGGEWFDALARMRVLVLDKTGTVTYGEFAVQEARHIPEITDEEFWMPVAVAEKFSEHPVGRIVFREAAKRFQEIPDPDAFRVHKGSGVWARIGQKEIVVGNEGIIREMKLALPRDAARMVGEKRKSGKETVFFIFVNGSFVGFIAVADRIRPEAAESVRRLRRLGVSHIAMFTGDSLEIAARVSGALGISEFRASMKPEDKLRELETFAKRNVVGMVGDGINDAPALARADVGIAMGGKGTAVAVEAADVVVLTDNLSRLPEAVLLARKTVSVIRGDMVIWLFSNVIGFALVLGGFAGPAFAAFYNFATDFLPLLNSARLFRRS